MGLDKVKRRYDETLRDPPEVGESTTRSGRKVRITTSSREVTLADLDAEELDEYRAMGFNVEKLRRAGFDPDADDPDKFCCEDYVWIPFVK